MPREESVAPKERINVVYRPATGDAQEEQELPLKLLVMGDFRLREDERPIEDRKPTPIDKDSFNEVMERENLTLTISVPNRLSDKKNETLPVTLNFTNMNDFGPDAIATSVPELQKLLQIREALTWLRGPLGNRREFRRRVEACISDPASRERLLKELGLQTDADAANADADKKTTNS